MKFTKIVLFGLLLSMFAACNQEERETKNEVAFLPNLKTDLQKN